MKPGKNVSTLNDSFFMSFQHIEAAQKSCPLLLVLESRKRVFWQYRGLTEDIIHRQIELLLGKAINDAKILTSIVNKAEEHPLDAREALVRGTWWIDQ
jgi:hypothetical protein